MGLLTPSSTPSLRPFPGSVAVLAAHGPVLPQPDQLCGPFAAWAALHAVLPAAAVPSVVDLAVAAGTRVWPHDVADWRPTGAPLDTTGWSALPVARSVDESGTDAGGLAQGIATLTDVTVVPASGAGDLAGLLGGLVDRGAPVGVLANVRTGPLGLDWDVGHFVVLHGVGDGVVGVADSYRELGAPGQPPGCRVVTLDALAAGLAAPPGRGLLLLVQPGDADDVGRLVETAGWVAVVWST